MGNGIDVSLFFTFWGLDMITKKRIDHLQLAPVANTSMKMSMMGVPTGNLGIPNLMGIIPGMTRFATWIMRKKIKEVERSADSRVLEMMVGRRREALRLQDDLRHDGARQEDFIDGVVDGVTVATSST